LENKTKRVVSGMRPTGRLHIGHYFGALQNWVRLQNDPSYDCLYFIADWHALTSDYADTSGIAQNVIEIATDYLAVGLDPKKCVIFQQSQIIEHAELHLLLSMVTPLGWLERVPTYKEALENVKDKDLHTYGFLGYPILQCADIVIYSQEGLSLVVPVGEDQVSHVELSREIVHRFDGFYYDFMVSADLFTLDNYHHFEFVLKAVAPLESKGQIEPPPLRDATRDEIAVYTSRIMTVVGEMGVRNFLELMGDREQFFVYRTYLTEPQAMLTQTPRIPGLDGRKMSKSYGNAIMLSESDADIRAKTKVMVTDPARKRRSDPGNPDVCPVYDWHKLFSPPETLEWSAQGCRTAGIGCIECKAAMADNLIKWIAPIRERRVEYEKNPKRVLQVIDEGSQKARIMAQRTMERVREAIFGWDKKRREIQGGSAAGA
jgi:tryptophanyl-tRNA synthetase